MAGGSGMRARKPHMQWDNTRLRAKTKKSQYEDRVPDGGSQRWPNRPQIGKRTRAHSARKQQECRQ